MNCSDLVGRNGTDRRAKLSLFRREWLRASNDGGRFHGHQREQLHHVVLHHVAQRARVVVVAAASFDAQRFGDGDLDVVDVFLVPKRLENFVGEPKRQDVLDGFLAEIMVDAENLTFVEDARQLMVQFLRCGEAATEWFLDNDPLRRVMIVCSDEPVRSPRVAG